MRNLAYTRILAILFAAVGLLGSVIDDITAEQSYLLVGFGLVLAIVGLRE